VESYLTTLREKEEELIKVREKIVT